MYVRIIKNCVPFVILIFGRTTKEDLQRGLDQSRKQQRIEQLYRIRLESKRRKKKKSNGNKEPAAAKKKRRVDLNRSCSKVDHNYGKPGKEMKISVKLRLVTS